MSKNQKGFSVVEVIIVILIIGLIGFAGWFIWQRQSKNSADITEPASNSNHSEETTGSLDLYDGWNTYNDGVVSFKYPDTWTAVFDANNPTGAVDINAPTDPTIRLMDDNGQPKQYENMQLTIAVVPKPSIEGSIDCIHDCDVFEVQPIDNPDIPEAKLIIAGSNHATYFIVTDDPNVEAGSSGYRAGVTVNGSIKTIGANVMFDQNGVRTSFGGIANLDGFKKTANYTDMLKIINTISFK